MEAQQNITNVAQLGGNVVSINNNTTIALNGGNMSGITTVPISQAGFAQLANIQTVQNSSNIQIGQNLPQIAWYTGDGQLISGQAIQLELANGTDISRQIGQQMHTQYGPIQVQLVQAPQINNGGNVQQQQVIPLQIQSQPQIIQHQQMEQNQNVQMEQQVQQIVQQVQQTIQFESVKTDPGAVFISADTTKKPRSKTVSSEKATCKLCNKTVSCAATLRDHMRTHTGERPYKCSECDLRFSQRSNLRMHKRLHTGERPYMCGICGKTFARSSHLPAHMRTHTGEKPYICETCGHAFITAQQLKNHNRVHTGEKPWKCECCNAAFTHSSSLSTHKKKHTGLKPFECAKCSKRFFFSSALDKHMKVHTKARPFQCPSCENTFKYKESLTVHMERYCGRTTEKKVRAPRKADAMKPGPKPGTGRKYVQQRKVRPRGRPRKRGRWNRRKNVAKREESPSLPADVDETKASTSEISNVFLPSPMQSEDIIEHDSTGVFYTAEADENIPVAELKVETVEGTDGTRILMDTLVNDGNNFDTSNHAGGSPRRNSNNNDLNLHSEIEDGSSFVDHRENNMVLSELDGSGPNIMSLDASGNFTLVSAEEAERQMSQGGLHYLQLPSELLMNNQNQIITAEQLQQLQQQFQIQSSGHNMLQQSPESEQHSLQLQSLPPNTPPPRHIQQSSQHHNNVQHVLLNSHNSNDLNGSAQQHVQISSQQSMHLHNHNGSQQVMSRAHNSVNMSHNSLSSIGQDSNNSQILSKDGASLFYSN